MLARGKVPPAQRSPPTKQLLELLGSSLTGEVLLSSEELPPPPAVYEHVDLASLSTFARRGWCARRLRMPAVAVVVIV